MKKLAGLMVLLVAVALSAAPRKDEIKGMGFGKIKSLVGDWEGRDKNGNLIRSSYKLVSNGTAVQEKLNPTNNEDMITIYYRDGDRLMLTHYCSEGNQPRMRAATEAGGNSLDFSFVDITNLQDPATGHMRHLVVSFQDDDHFTQKWTWREKGRERVDIFHFTRKR